jgi:BCD family chlorophyll transporter-like MFS transporter
MVVELALPALLPGLLVTWHYAVQFSRPRMGHGSDLGQRRTPWIVGGMAVLALGGTLAALATVWMAEQRVAGIALAVLAFSLVGIGVSACGTSLLVLLAKRVPESRRAPAATLVWMMMIFGFALTSGLAGELLEPFSPARLVAVSATVSVLAVVLTLLAVLRLEGPARPVQPGSEPAAAKPAFRQALQQVWAEAPARRFTVFVFVSMLAYSAQDLILEPFAGVAFGYTPGQSTQLAGVQHGGVLLGMILVALCGHHFVGRRLGSLRGWMIGGCIASALALTMLAAAGGVGPGWPLRPTVFFLGVANGAFAIAAIATMMHMAGQGRARRDGLRMGLWGAAQAIAFGLGGLAGAAASDLARWLIADAALAYAGVFALEALLFVWAAALALRVGAPAASRALPPAPLGLSGSLIEAR